MATILVVDDDPGSRTVLAEILHDEGHEVIAVESAAQARISYERDRPDLVLLDIWLPEVDGITLLKEWHAGGQLTKPVIVLSAHASIAAAVEATRFGATAVLDKPVDLHKLLYSVESELSKSKSAAARDTLVEPSAAILERRPDPGREVPVMPVRIGLQARQVFVLDQPLREARYSFERTYFEFHLERQGGSIPGVAKKTGLERTHLYRKLKQLGLDARRDRDKTPACPVAPEEVAVRPQFPDKQM